MHWTGRTLSYCHSCWVSRGLFVRWWNLCKQAIALRRSNAFPACLNSVKTCPADDIHACFTCLIYNKWYPKYIHNQKHALAMCLTPVFIFHVHRFLCLYLFAWGFAHAPLCGLPQLQDLPGRLGDRQVADVRLALLKDGKDQQNEATERMEKGKVTLISFVLRGHSWRARFVNGFPVVVPCKALPADGGERSYSGLVFGTCSLKVFAICWEQLLHNSDLSIEFELERWAAFLPLELVTAKEMCVLLPASEEHFWPIAAIRGIIYQCQCAFQDPSTVKQISKPKEGLTLIFLIDLAVDLVHMYTGPPIKQASTRLKASFSSSTICATSRLSSVARHLSMRRLTLSVLKGLRFWSNPCWSPSVSTGQGVCQYTMGKTWFDSYDSYVFS